MLTTLFLLRHLRQSRRYSYGEAERITYTRIPAEVRRANRQAVSFIGRADVLRAINQACEDPQDFKRLLTNPIASLEPSRCGVPRGALITAATRRSQEVCRSV